MRLLNNNFMVGLSAETKTFFDLDKAGIEFVFNLNYLGTYYQRKSLHKIWLRKEGRTSSIFLSMDAFTPFNKIPA